MVYTLEALVADEKTLQKVAAQFQNAKVVLLQQGIALVPLTHELTEEIHRSYNQERVRAFDVDGFYGLSNAVMELAARASIIAPIAYIEAELFGGAGTQAAIIWQDGKIVYGPFVSGTDPFVMEKLPMREWAFNAALRVLGVTADNGKDEFDTVGLGLHRQTHEWA